MPTTDAAPLMSALPVTFFVAGSIITIDLPSTGPMIEPADAVFANAEAMSAPATANVFSCMEISRYRERQTGMLPPPAMTGRATGTNAGGCSLAAAGAHVLVSEETRWSTMDGFAGSLLSIT